MKNTLHTPGPWDIFPKDETLEIGNYGANAPLVRLSATVPTNDWEGWANARLIASAPDLLSALEEMMSVFQDHEQYDEDSAEVIQFAREVIRKAKGEA